MRLPTPSFTAFTGTPCPFGGTTPKILKAIRLWAITFSDAARLRTVICEFSPIFQNTSLSEPFLLRVVTRASFRAMRATEQKQKPPRPTRICFNRVDSLKVPV
jgi:hypothetical protein